MRRNPVDMSTKIEVAKKLTRTVISFIAISIIVVLAIVSQIVSGQDGKPSLEMKVMTLRDFHYCKDDAPLDIVIRNDKSLPVRFLNVFDDYRLTTGFFTVVLRDKNGTPIGPFGGGSVSLLLKSIRYTELKKGEELHLRINLKDFLPKDYAVEPGDYDISITYSNKYGRDCFMGTLESKSVKLHLNQWRF